MKKRLKLMVLSLIFLMSTNIYAYQWIENQSNWYVYNESSGKFLSNVLLDVGNNVYYFDETGKMITGWWKNTKTNKYYFFDNNIKRNLGGMVFGLHMIDGYLYYFGDDGSLQTSEKEGTYRKVYQEYYADSEGHLYYDNTLMKDESISKSEYYTNPIYYTKIEFNNYYLANYDIAGRAKEITNKSKSEINMANATNGKAKSSASTTSGGTNYDVDENGKVHTYGDIFETSAAEKYGPMGNK